MKLEPNMYIRDTRDGKIYKLTDIGLKLRPQKTTYDFEKASHNIIDLIEIGDYVNGYKIVKIFCYNGKKLLIALIREEDEYSDKLEDYMCDDSIHIFEENIKTILTHEQFENNCYKIGEIKC